MDLSFERYLEAKRTVDDRALNRNVTDLLRAELRAIEQRDPLRIVELGAGTGYMVIRALEWGLLSRAEYTLVDVDPALLKTARARLSEWAGSTGFAVKHDGDDALVLSRGGTTLRVRTRTADFSEFLGNVRPSSIDLLIACAVLDLTHVPSLLPLLWRLLKPGGLFWFAINFDGETIFLPEHDLDAIVMHRYHRSMDLRMRNGQPAGDSKTGRRLFQHFRDTNAEILASGASDWVVYPYAGKYVQDEAYFLHHIVDTIWQELKTHPEIDAERFRSWIAQRHAQVENGELIYIAHQLDFVGRTPRL